MGNRIEFKMTEEELREIMEECDPNCPITIMLPQALQKRANAAGMKLGKKLNFKWDTVMPVKGKSNRFFTAEIDKICSHGYPMIPDVEVVEDLSKLTEEQKSKKVLYIERPAKTNRRIIK